jgi:hypothetical protein
MADRLTEFAEKCIYYADAKIERLEMTSKHAFGLTEVGREEVEHELRHMRRWRDQILEVQARRAARLRLN